MIVTGLSLSDGCSIHGYSSKKRGCDCLQTSGLTQHSWATALTQAFPYNRLRAALQMLCKQPQLQGQHFHDCGTLCPPFCALSCSQPPTQIAAKKGRHHGSASQWAKWHLWFSSIVYRAIAGGEKHASSSSQDYI